MRVEPVPFPEDPALQVSLYPVASGARGTRWHGWYVAADAWSFIRIERSWSEIYKVAARRVRRSGTLVRVWWVGEGRASLVLEIAPAPPMVENIGLQEKPAV